jgi:hypothetical protein
VLIQAATTTREERDTSGWTNGVIRGDIQLSVAALDKIKSIQVIVEEARGEFDAGGNFRRRWQKVVPVERGVGTPTFEVTDVPFSDYPYQVIVYSPGLNGSRRMVSLSQQAPFVGDVVLAITPAAPFSILVRDQDNLPFTGVDVLLQPVGDPAGRPVQRGTSDNFGSLVLPSVLAGDYQLSVSEGGQLLTPTQTITVQPGASYRTAVQGQCHTVSAPRGVGVTFQVHDSSGYGIPEAKVSAICSDRVRLTTVETLTDGGGRATFSHLQPGRWQVTVEKDRFQRVDLMLTMQLGQPAETRNVKLIRLR